MNTNQLMTVGAIAFAGFALWYVARKPSGQVATQPGQAARDAGLIGWFNHLSTQQNELATKANDDYMDELKRKGIL
jgi:hypothetical protein